MWVFGPPCIPVAQRQMDVDTASVSILWSKCITKPREALIKLSTQTVDILFVNVHWIIIEWWPMERGREDRVPAYFECDFKCDEVFERDNQREESSRMIIGLLLLGDEWWGAGVFICLERGANDLHVVQLMPLPSRHLLIQENPKWLILLAPLTQVITKRL